MTRNEALVKVAQMAATCVVVVATQKAIVSIVKK